MEIVTGEQIELEARVTSLKKHLSGEQQCRAAALAHIGRQGDLIASLRGLLREAGELLAILEQDAQLASDFGFRNAPAVLARCVEVRSRIETAVNADLQQEAV